MTAYFVSNMIKNQYDWLTMKTVSNKKTLSKLIIFIACFVLEDIGQVLLQVMLDQTKNSFFNRSADNVIKLSR